jgi:hypothetical protein
LITDRHASSAFDDRQRLGNDIQSYPKQQQRSRLTENAMALLLRKDFLHDHLLTAIQKDSTFPTRLKHGSNFLQITGVCIAIERFLLSSLLDIVTTMIKGGLSWALCQTVSLA